MTYKRDVREAQHFRDLPEEELRQVMYETVLALYDALEFEDAVFQGSHPAKIIEAMRLGNLKKV